MPRDGQPSGSQFCPCGLGGTDLGFRPLRRQMEIFATDCLLRARVIPCEPLLDKRPMEWGVRASIALPGPKFLSFVPRLYDCNLISNISFSFFNCHRSLRSPSTFVRNL